jgi:hypothetical protein
MASTDHRIRRQHWQVRARTKAEAFALRQRLRDTWAETLAPVFEQAFDARAGGDEVVRVPRLHLHVRLAPGEDPVARLPELVARALDEQWPGAAAPSVSASTERRRAGSTKDPAGRVREPQSLDAVASARDDLIAYLESGHLPWHLAGRPAAEIRTLLACLAERERAAVLARWRLQPPLPEVFARLLQLTPVAGWQELAREFLALGESPARSGAGITRVAEAIAASATPVHVARMLVEARATDRAATRLQGDETPTAPRTPTPATKRAPHATRTDSTHERRTHGAGSPADASPKDHPAEQLAHLELNSTPESGSDAPHALHVPHAGLVLLHPFLPRFFAATGVLPGGATRPAEDALPRAAALLHLLATGGEAPACDFELPIIRVLLGLAPDDPLQADAACSAQDREEAEAMLQSVITHWSALRSTSPAGLRTTFLRRPGLLRPMDAAWLLQLERGPFDVLVDRLPWALGVIKLPWMPRPLHTEW